MSVCLCRCVSPHRPLLPIFCYISSLLTLIPASYSSTLLVTSHLPLLFQHYQICSRLDPPSNNRIIRFALLPKHRSKRVLYLLFHALIQFSVILAGSLTSLHLRGLDGTPLYSHTAGRDQTPSPSRRVYLDWHRRLATTSCDNDINSCP